MIFRKGVAHAPDYDFKIAAPRVVIPTQRGLEAGLQQTLETLVGGRLTELASERAEFAHVFLRRGPRGKLIGCAHCDMLGNLSLACGSAAEAQGRLNGQQPQMHPETAAKPPCWLWCGLLLELSLRAADHGRREHLVLCF